MKNGSRSILVAVIGVIAIAGLLAIAINPHKSTTVALNQPKTNSAIDISSTKATHGSNSASPVVEFFKIVTDPQTGQYAAVNSDWKSVISRKQSGEIAWSNNIIRLAEGQRLNFYSGKIDLMEAVGNELVVHVGNMSIEIDKQSGKILDDWVR
jgi:hypothetical protein